MTADAIAFIEQVVGEPAHVLGRSIGEPLTAVLARLDHEHHHAPALSTGDLEQIATPALLMFADKPHLCNRRIVDFLGGTRA